MDKKEYQQWLDGLKEGDEVFYSGGRFYGGTIAKVKRFTPSRMIGLSNGTMVNKDGSIRGDKYFSIHPVTQKNRDEIEKRRLYSKVRAIDFGRLSLEQLREVAKATGIK